jgi:hypothetical protein
MFWGRFLESRHGSRNPTGCRPFGNSSELLGVERDSKRTNMKYLFLAITERTSPLSRKEAESGRWDQIETVRNIPSLQNSKIAGA